MDNINEKLEEIMKKWTSISTICYKDGRNLNTHERILEEMFKINLENQEKIKKLEEESTDYLKRIKYLENQDNEINKILKQLLKLLEKM